MNKEINATIIFDNGGGITLQLGDWAHCYSGYSGCIEQAAEDYKTYIESGNTDGWDGHEDLAAELTPTDDDIRNGCLRVYGSNDIADYDGSTGWYNIDKFCSLVLGE